MFRDVTRHALWSLTVLASLAENCGYSVYLCAHCGTLNICHRKWQQIFKAASVAQFYGNASGNGVIGHGL